MSQAATAERMTDDSQRPAGGISPRVVVNAVWRHPFAFFGVVLLALLAGLGIWFFLPLPKKTAAVVFHVSSQATPGGGSDRADFNSYKQTQLALVTNRRTLNKVLDAKVDDNGVEKSVKGLEIIRTADPDALTWLDNHIKVESKTGSEFIRVTIEGDNEKELEILVTALKNVYLTAAKDHDNAAKVALLNDLQERFKGLNEQLIVTKKAIESNREYIGSRDPAYQFFNDQFRREEFMRTLLAQGVAQDNYKARVGDLNAANKYLESLRSAATRTSVMSVAGTLSTPFLKESEAGSENRIPTAAVEAAFANDPAMQQLEALVVRAREILGKNEELTGPTSESAKKAREALKLAEHNRENYRLENRARIEARLKENAILSAESHIDQMRTEVRRTKNELDRAVTKVEEQQNSLKKLEESKAEISRLEESIAHKEPLAQKMASDIERLKLEIGAPARVTPSEEPHVLQGIEGNRRLKYALMAGLGALVLGFGGLVMWEHRSRRVTRTEEVTTELGTRLIGTIPPLVAEAGVASSHEVNSPLVEAIDTTRIMLTHAGTDGSKLRVLMVTSAVSGEGKTTLSGNLAISLTRAGFRTLLIDGDMQAPSAHLLFDVPDAPGLSELLRDETDLARAVRPSPIPGLSILPAGRWNMSTRQSLVGDRWRTLKKQLESEFDFVVIDTSPLLMVSDAMLLAREADGVVLSVLLGVSQIARVAETVNRLHAIGAELAGVVVNNVQSQVYRRYMSRAKYAAPPPVAPDQEEVAFAEEADAGTTEEMAEEIGAESTGNVGER